MNKVRLLLALVVLAMMLAVPAAALAQSTGIVTGSAVIAQRIALPRTSSGSWILVVAILLLVLAVGVHMLRSRLNARPLPEVAALERTGGLHSSDG